MKTLVDDWPKPFKFLNMWCLDNNLNSVVEESWNIPVESGPMKCFALNLKRLNEKLKEWNDTHIKNIFQNVKELEDEMLIREYAFENNNSVKIISETQECKAKLNQALMMEEIFWQKNLILNGLRRVM